MGSGSEQQEETAMKTVIPYMRSLGHNLKTIANRLGVKLVFFCTYEAGKEARESQLG